MQRILTHTRFGMIGLLAIIMQTAAGDAVEQSGPTLLAIEWQTIDGGGGVSTSGTLRLVSTIGQPDSGTSSAGSLELNGGFMPGTFDPVNPCPADVNDDTFVDVEDLLDLLAAWGVCPATCPPDGDGNGVVDVEDLLVLLAAWGVCP